jgi:hypothetical protein
VRDADRDPLVREFEAQHVAELLDAALRRGVGRDARKGASAAADEMSR